MKQDFETMSKMVTELKATNSSNAKKAILSNYTDNEFIATAFIYAMSPYKQYGISAPTARKLAKKLEPTNNYTDLFKLLDDLDSRVISGHAGVKALLGFVENNKTYEDLIYAILSNNLQTRTSGATINKVFGNIIPSFNVALAKAYQPTDCDFENETWYASRKLDGVRCLIFTGPDNNPKALSRSGKPLETIQKCLDDIKTLNLPNMVFDGEICLVDADGNDDFNGIMRVIKRKDYQIENPKFKIFDMITQNDFDTKKSTTTLGERIMMLENITSIESSLYIDILAQEIVTSQNVFNKWADWVKEFNWEGFMLRKDATYIGNRSNQLLKVKTMMDDEYEVLAITPGLIRHVVYNPILEKNEEITSEMTSNLVIKHKGNYVEVGSGLTQKQRQEFHADPASIIGKTITVQYFEETENLNGTTSLRFPVLKYVYENGRTV